MRLVETKKLINSSDISDPLCDKDDNETGAGDLIEKLAEYIAYWPWFLVSFFCCLCVAYLYLNTVTPMYKITAKILIKDGNKGGSFASEVSSLEQMGFMDVTSSFDNELEVLRSESLIKQAVFDMKGYCRYSVKGLFADDNLNDFSPVLVDMYAKENENLQWPIVMEIRQYPDSSISVAGICNGNPELTFHGRLLKLPGVINTPSGRLRFSFNPGIAPIYGNSIHVTVFPAIDMADEYASRLEVTPTSKTTSVAELSFTDSNKKREENSIRMAANVDNAKVIDAARARKGPISPKTKLVYLIACVLGLAIPVGALYVIDLFRYKIADLSDVKALTHIPVLGEIPLYKHSGERKDFLVVKENENDFMSEAFRRLRTDLGFLLSPQEKVLLFASTTMGEGKTFISTNLAMSLALLNKKVVLVGLDIRRPRLAEHFGFSTQVAGITSYLSYGTDDLFSLLQSTPHSANLKILPAGKVPPNPGELLAGARLQQAIDILRKEFDYVLIDTSPVSVISDTLIAGRIADLTVYVCRVGVTHKKAFRFINSLHSEQKLPHIAMAVNAVNLKKYNHGYYGYGPYNTIN